MCFCDSGTQDRAVLCGVFVPGEHHVKQTLASDRVLHTARRSCEESEDLLFGRLFSEPVFGLLHGPRSFLPVVLSLPPWHGVELGSETLAKSATSDYLLCGQLIARRPHSVQRHLPKWMEPKGQSLPTWCREEEITKSQDKQSCPVLSQVAQLCWGAKLLLYFVGSLSHILTHSEL